MQTNSEIRNEAWRLLWKRGWFWKLLAASILLSVCAQAAVTVVNGIVYRLGVFNMTAMMNLAQTRKPMPEFTPRLAWEFSSSTLLYLFFVVIMGGIVAYGISVLLIRSTDDNDDGWLGAAFGGFKTPLGLAWLYFRICLVYFFWGVLGAMPGAAVFAWLYEAAPPTGTPIAIATCTIAFAASAFVFIAVYCIPFYKYRYIFRLKADHPDWTAGKCMRSCRELVYGNKWRIFLHDCSYWRIILLAMIPMLAIVAMVLVAVLVSGGAKPSTGPSTATIVVGLFGTLIGIAAYLAMLALGMISALYIGVGQTIHYREISRERQIQEQTK